MKNNIYLFLITFLLVPFFSTANVVILKTPEWLKGKEDIAVVCPFNYTFNHQEVGFVSADFFAFLGLSDHSFWSQIYNGNIIKEEDIDGFDDNFSPKLDDTNAGINIVKALFKDAKDADGNTIGDIEDEFMFSYEDQYILPDKLEIIPKTTVESNESFYLKEVDNKASKWYSRDGGRYLPPITVEYKETMHREWVRQYNYWVNSLDAAAFVVGDASVYVIGVKVVAEGPAAIAGLVLLSANIVSWSVDEDYIKVSTITAGGADIPPRCWIKVTPTATIKGFICYYKAYEDIDGNGIADGAYDPKRVNYPIYFVKEVIFGAYIEKEHLML